MNDRIDPSAADPTLERREIGDVRNGEIGVPIEIRAIARGEVVDHDDIVAARDQRVDDVAAKKTRAARDEHPQPTTAP